MFSNQRLQNILEEVTDITKTGLMLYDEQGKLIASSCQEETDVSDTVVSFAESMAESQLMCGFHFFKVFVDGMMEYVLLVKATSEEAYLVGRLVGCQVKNYMEASRESSDRNTFMQNVLLGNILVVDMYNKAKKLHINQGKRRVYVIEVQGKKTTVVTETVRQLFSEHNGDFVTELDEENIILIKDTSGMNGEEDAELLARTIVDHLQMEAMVSVRVGYGSVVEQLQDLPKTYQEAKMALEVGRIFYAEKRTMTYANLGIGRLIYQLPMSLCEQFIQEVLGDRVLELDEESMMTIQRFFENNLNISETARQLFIHRNTLVYRLERLQKQLGLDIRKFEDAMTFKIAMMVMAQMKKN